MATVTCPVCGISSVDGVFYFSYRPAKAVTASEVYTKVCRRAKNTTGCINSCSTYSESLDFPMPVDITVDKYLDVVKTITTQE